MITELIEFIRTWHPLIQCFFVIVVSGFLTFIILGILGIVGDFLNVSLPILVRGYAPVRPTEKTEETTE